MAARETEDMRRRMRVRKERGGDREIDAKTEKKYWRGGKRESEKVFHFFLSDGPIYSLHVGRHKAIASCDG